MHAEIRTVKEPALRVKIVQERSDFDQNPHSFIDEHQSEQVQLQDQLIRAQKQLSAVTIEDDLRIKISQVCSELDVDGLRGDIVCNRAAKALAAFEGRNEATADDIRRIITLCLRHRLRKDPLESIDSGNKVMKIFNQVFGFSDDLEAASNSKQPVGAGR
jgi:magnesium chelatase subunit I